MEHLHRFAAKLPGSAGWVLMELVTVGEVIMLGRLSDNLNLGAGTCEKAIDYLVKRNLCTVSGREISLSPDYLDVINELSESGFQYAGFVYVMFCKTTGLYKIGYSINPERRRNQLQKAEREVIDITFSIPVRDMRRSEAELHQKFSALRVRGEWFALQDADLARIKSKAGI